MFLTDLINIAKLYGRQRRSVELNKKIYESMCDVSDVAAGYDYYRNFLFEKLIKIFKYEGLPATIPQDALEDYILRFGISGVVDSEYGQVAVPTTKHGVGLYPHYEPSATWATPLVEGYGTIGEDIIIFKNNSYELSCESIVNRYARMLADADSTISNTMYNLRKPMIPAFPSEEGAESYKAFEVANRLGQTDAVIDKAIIGQMQMYPSAGTIAPSTMNDLITARQDILRMFLAEIGVSTANEKRERMTEEEVNANAQMLLFNIRDMYDCRKKAVEDMNRLFGLNASVRLSEEYELIQSQRAINRGGEDNVEAQNN